MKHHELWRKVAAECGHHLEATGSERLEVFRQWLDGEAIPAGALGPAEGGRLHDRHIADSLVFSAAYPAAPPRVLDYGSGAGLPGIPLAVLWSETEFLLLDRSGKRVDLMRRAIRILDLENVQVAQGEIERHQEKEPAVVSRATLPPERAAAPLQGVLAPGGSAVLGGSWSARPEVPGFETMEFGSKILDRTIWLLIMRRT